MEFPDGGEFESQIFLSIQAQDFIEEVVNMPRAHKQAEFLSIQAQDFIEDGSPKSICMLIMSFLSIQAQDFIEDPATCQAKCRTKDS